MFSMDITEIALPRESEGKTCEKEMKMKERITDKNNKAKIAQTRDRINDSDFLIKELKKEKKKMVFAHKIK